MILRSILYAVLLAPSWVLADNRELIELVSQRLSYMEKVAAYKWANQLPIEDQAREAIVLDHAVTNGLRYGVRVETSRALFQQQISAAREIQHYWFKHWETHPGPGDVPDLNLVIRPELIRLGNAITKRLRSNVGDSTPLNEFLTIVAIEGLSAPGKQLLYEVLSSIERYDHRLQQVLDSGVLRVGTTGDYAPFSYRPSPEASYVGIDIDLAKDLAQTPGVEFRFIKTNWPSLLADLKAGRYDIAMSGISRNLDRQKVGYFSNAYHKGGKTPISLCLNINNFNSLQKIDQKGVRIIVNPGGTNERFLNKNLKHAEKVLHEDNRTIFEAIIGGTSDLMITDAIEVQLQANRHKQLCPTMPGKTLTYSEKGYLMPQETQFKEYVDLWLATRLADGTVKSTFKKHLD